MEASMSTGSSSINTITEYMSTLQDDSELEASSAKSVEIQGENLKAEEIRLQSIAAKEVPLKEQKVSGRKFRKMYWVALAALMNAFCMGFAGTYTATAGNDMRRRGSIIQPNDDQLGWIGSLLPLGALFGGLVAGHLSQSLGRKGVLLISSLPFTAGWLFIAYGTSLAFLYTGRIIIGFCCGLVSVTTPMYLVEISTPDVRGLLGASFQLFVTIGILSVALLGSFLPWTWLALVGACFSVQSMILVTLIPESPRWLVAQGKRKEALHILKYLQGEFLDAEQECQSIESDIKKQPTGSFQLQEITAPEAYKPVLLSFLLMFFQQCSGVNAVLFYTGKIFETAGSTIPSNLCTIIVAFTQVFSTALSNILIDKTGRKFLLIASGVLMGISLFIFGAFDLAAERSGEMGKEIREKYGWLSLVSLIMFISAFSLGFGPIPWLMVSEMTTPRLRSATSGTSTALNWMFAFAVTNSYNNLIRAMGNFGAYFFYSGICFTSSVFTFYFIPETKGKDIEDIRQYFLEKKQGSVRMIDEISERKVEV